jgi:hypothetical protein
MGAAATLRKQIESALAGRIPAALSPRPASPPELLSCGLEEVDAMLGGGLPLGAITELTGPHSSGLTTLALATLAGLTRQGQSCAYVDVSDALDPLSAASLGMDLRRLLWVRPVAPRSALRLDHVPRSDHALRLDSALRATDLLLSAGGFRALVLDLGDLPPEQASRIPLATWYRFRLQAEKSRTLFLLITLATCGQGCAHQGCDRQGCDQSCAQGHAKSCAAVSLHGHPASANWRQAAPGSPPLLDGLHNFLSLERSRAVDPTRRMPADSTPVATSKAAWSSTAPWTG